jgi:hypothetical protein
VCLPNDDGGHESLGEDGALWVAGGAAGIADGGHVVWLGRAMGRREAAAESFDCARAVSGEG